MLTTRHALRTLSILALILLALASANLSLAQDAFDYSMQTGTPAFGDLKPFPGGFVNIANGNIRVEISEGNFPQRGTISPRFFLAYDSRIWRQGWTLLNGFGWLTVGGWREFTGDNGGSMSATVTDNVPCVGAPRPGQTNGTLYYGPFVWTDATNTPHLFPFQIQGQQCVSNNSGDGRVPQVRLLNLGLGFASGAWRLFSDRRRQLVRDPITEDVTETAHTEIFARVLY